MYEDQIGTRLIVSAVLTLVALSMLGYCAWARHGGSPRARQWMDGHAGGWNWFDERMTVLGAPAVALICLCVAASLLPVVGRYLLVITIPVGFLLLIPVLVTILPFIPLPGFLYPRWARPMLRRQR